MPGLKYFIVSDDDRIIPVSMSKVNRLDHCGYREDDAAGPLPEFAGQRVRWAMLYYETENRRPVQPVRLLAAQYGMWEIDATGQMDKAFGRLMAADCMDCLDDPTRPSFWKQQVDNEDRAKGLVPGRSRFTERAEAQAREGRAKKVATYNWQPSPEIRARLVEAVTRRVR